MLTNYTVQAGDSLWKIGRNVVGLNWRFIKAMNPQIADPNKIVVGQVIKIPNPTLVKCITESIDLLMLLCPYKVGLFIALLQFLVQAGSFQKQDVTQFLVSQGISVIFAAKVEAFYYALGKDKVAVIYDWWCRFWDYGICKAYESGQK